MRVFRLSAILSATFLVAGGLVYMLDRPVGGLAEAPPYFTADPVRFDLVLFQPGEHEITLRLTNSTATSRRILGLVETCGRNCCYRAKVREVVTVGPGETADYTILLTVQSAGEFETTVEIFLEENGIRTLQVDVSGNVMS